MASKNTKKKRQPQGHPANTTPKADPLDERIERLATQSVHLVRDIIRSGRFDADQVLTAKAASIGYLTLLAVIEGKPTPYEIHEYEGNLNAAVIEEIALVREASQGLVKAIEATLNLLDKREEQWADLFVPDLRALADIVRTQLSIANTQIEVLS